MLTLILLAGMTQQPQVPPIDWTFYCPQPDSQWVEIPKCWDWIHADQFQYRIVTSEIPNLDALTLKCDPSFPFGSPGCPNPYAPSAPEIKYPMGISIGRAPWYRRIAGQCCYVEMWGQKYYYAKGKAAK